MHVTKFQDATAYAAPKHFDMRALRLQGSPESGAVVGLSHFLPGGGAGMDSSAGPKIYVVLSGSVRITLDDGTEQELTALDSCLIEAGETRSVDNDSNEVATMLVIALAATGKEGDHAQ
ncbi:hypothetical protein AWB85_01120 [Mycobacteroides immunogenum]|uniref:Cupin type-2 domain-containing protein n=2 Tax=Mycobacteroides immunogenum TaxID=83262 RepID=A0A179VDS3_9MYCO|nr:hypothetical protein AWB85_01120 [Mycobacteroides immunogenum]